MFCKLLSVPHNIVMDLNDVTSLDLNIQIDTQLIIFLIIETTVIWIKVRVR